MATNTILERKGAKTALIITKGYKDVIEFGMLGRYKPGGLFQPDWVRDPPYVPRCLRLEVDERISSTGEVLRALRGQDILDHIEILIKERIEAVAVCFLNSYVNPSHEQRVEELLRQHVPTNIPVSLSAEIVREHGEYERWATAVLNAYVSPQLREYLGRLRNSLHSGGYQGEVFYMTSSGGVVTETTAARYPIRFILSGPAGGVAAGTFIGEATGFKNIITYDMGGTSTDVCLIKDLKRNLISERVFESVPIKTPLLDITTIGAGGGSIAWIDKQGGLKVGPQSSGARPGPICYNLGGVEITVTDANLLLGRLSEMTLLSGRMRLDKSLTEKAMASMAQKLNMTDMYRLADGIIKVCVNHMAGAIRTLSVARGHDPRDFTLFSFGGAGPMHAIPICEEVGISRVLVPRDPGHTCAFGMLTSDLTHDYVRTYVTELKKADLTRMRRLLAEMADDGRRALVAEGISGHRIDTQYSLDMRYLGQSGQLNVPVSCDFEIPDMERAFHREYHKTYGYSREEMPVELVYLRLIASAAVDRPSIRGNGAKHCPLAKALKEERQMYLEGDWINTPVYQRDLIGPGTSIDGPAIFEELGATTVLFPGWKASIDDFADLILERTGD